jgi:hypothetical protein
MQCNFNSFVRKRTADDLMESLALLYLLVEVEMMECNRVFDKQLVKTRRKQLFNLTEWPTPGFLISVWPRLTHRQTYC